MYSKL